MPIFTDRGIERYRVSPRLTASTDPAANTELSFTVPSNQLLEVWSLNFTLVTDANAATRRVVLTIDDGTTVWHRTASQVTQAASLTQVYTFAVGAPDRSAVAGTDVYQALAGPLLLRPGYRIKTVTASIQATDNYGVMQIYGNRYTA